MPAARHASGPAAHLHRRRRLLLALGGASIAGVLQQALAAGSKPVPPGMHKLAGDVRINGVPAREGQPVAPGDTVTTGPGSQAIYVVGQDAFLQHENSVIRFGSSAAADFFRIVTGRLLAVFGKGSKRLATPTATIGIRGTGCYLEAEPARTYFCLCYGDVEIVPAGAPGRPVRYATTYHDRPYYIEATGETPMLPAPVINHTDAELTMLETLCGRRPPFYGMGGYY